VEVLRHIGLDAGQYWTFNLIGSHAVLCFYIVSGFLISYALHNKYSEDQSGTAVFFRSRFLRIYPLWWVVLILSASVGAHEVWFHEHGLLELLPSAIIFGLDWIVPFWNYPTQYWNLLPWGAAVGWTLGAELTFYLMAPWLLRDWRWALGAFAISAVVRSSAIFLLHWPSPQYTAWTYFFFPSTLRFFLLGHFAERLSRSFSVGLVPSLALLIVSAAFSSLSRFVDGWSPEFAFLCFAAALPGLFAATKDNPALNFMGDLTYPLYLTHALTIAALFWPWEILKPVLGERLIALDQARVSTDKQGIVLFAAALAIALCAAAAVHLAIENPLRRVCAWLLQKGARALRSTSPQTGLETGTGLSGTAD
jgi:peptidoglycan/LPS O-acetylase OafA/YrhL